MELAAALDGTARLAEERDEQSVLERLVEVACDVAHAEHGLALLVGPDGRPCALAHVGLSEQQVAALPLVPRPAGLIGLVLAGAPLRLARFDEHPRASTPSYDPRMAALLGRPITVDGCVQGGLYLTRAAGEPPFGETDERRATALARLAAAAVSALRSAGAAGEVLGGLGATSRRGTDSDDDAPSPVIRRLLATTRSVLGMDVTYLSRLHDGEQTYRFVDAVAGAQAPPEDLTVDATAGYCLQMLDGTIDASVPDLQADPRLAGHPANAFGFGAYCGVPVHLPDGTLYGTLCGLHATATASPTGAQLQAMRTLAGLMGSRLAEEQQHDRVRRARRSAFAPLLDAPGPSTGLRRTVVLQPIVDLGTGRPVGYEALSRFTDATGAPQRPDHVFAEAQELGLGVELELAAAASALRLLPDLPAQTYLSVNLSPAALVHPATAELLAGVPAERVVVELTEHEQVGDYAAVLRSLAGLRALGLRLAIDDTGSGFASLQHLARLLPEVVKLDIAFVRDIHAHPARRAVARAVLGFANEVGAVLVAEGIETPAELDQLRRLGAVFGQGFHLGRPDDPARVLAAVDTPPTTR